jgi:hypothetical protein
VVDYHLVNLALHGAAVCLVPVILRTLAIPGALLAAAFFALHPVHVESVAWITDLAENDLNGVRAGLNREPLARLQVHG